MYLHKTKNGHYTPPCCYFSGELEVVECLPQTFSCGMMVKDYIIGSCKYRNEKIGVDELDLIRDYASVFGKGNNYSQNFSRCLHHIC